MRGVSLRPLTPALSPVMLALVAGIHVFLFQQ